MWISRETWPRPSLSSSAALVALAALVAACAAAGGTSAPRPAGLVFDRQTGQRTAVWVADANGAHPRKVADEAFNGRLSSDGRWLAFSRTGGRDGDLLYVVDLDTGKGNRVSGRYAYAWSPTDARLVVTGTRGSFVLDAAGSKRSPLPGSVYWYGFAPGGIVIGSTTNGKTGTASRGDVIAYRPSDKISARLTGDGHSDGAVWGPNWVVFRHFSFKKHGFQLGALWMMRHDGSKRRLLASVVGSEQRSTYGFGTVAVSTDGTRLLACVQRESSCSPVTLTVPGGLKHKLSAGKGLVTQAAGLSRDGRQVLVTAGTLDRGSNAYVLPFAGGKARLIVRNAASASWAGS